MATGVLVDPPMVVRAPTAARNADFDSAIGSVIFKTGPKMEPSTFPPFSVCPANST